VFAGDDVKANDGLFELVRWHSTNALEGTPGLTVLHARVELEAFVDDAAVAVGKRGLVDELVQENLGSLLVRHEQHANPDAVGAVGILDANSVGETLDDFLLAWVRRYRHPVLAVLHPLWGNWGLRSVHLYLLGNHPRLFRIYVGLLDAREKLLLLLHGSLVLADGLQVLVVLGGLLLEAGRIFWVVVVAAVEPDERHRLGVQHCPNGHFLVLAWQLRPTVVLEEVVGSV
jgi:hypothetical protein